MLQLTLNDNILGYTENPMYCYKLPSGSPQIIGNRERTGGAVATGIMYLGVIYNLPGHDDFEDAETVYTGEVDAGLVIESCMQYVNSLNAAGADMDNMAIDQELRITILELGLDEEEGI